MVRKWIKKKTARRKLRRPKVGAGCVPARGSTTAAASTTGAASTTAAASTKPPTESVSDVNLRRALAEVGASMRYDVQKRKSKAQRAAKAAALAAIKNKEERIEQQRARLAALHAAKAAHPAFVANCDEATAETMTLTEQLNVRKPRVDELSKLIQRYTHKK
jgi:hypothetical protein